MRMTAMPWGGGSCFGDEDSQDSAMGMRTWHGDHAMGIRTNHANRMGAFLVRGPH